MFVEKARVKKYVVGHIKSTKRLLGKLPASTTLKVFAARPESLAAHWKAVSLTTPLKRRCSRSQKSVKLHDAQWHCQSCCQW